MFGPDYTAGCPACSAIADGFNGSAVHLANHDVMLWAVSRAPLVKLKAYKQRMGWTFPWASSFGGDFNPDFSVHFTAQQQREGGIEYNYQREEAMPMTGSSKGPVTDQAAMTGTDVPTYTRERPGMSAFVLEDGVRLPYLFRLCARTGWPVGHVSVARPGSQGAQRVRARLLVAPPRRIRQELIAYRKFAAMPASG
jgi:predicted dithiol-disulfide oxidoreductase (DUF899 family)